VEAVRASLVFASSGVTFSTLAYHRGYFSIQYPNGQISAFCELASRRSGIPVVALALFTILPFVLRYCPMADPLGVECRNAPNFSSSSTLSKLVVESSGAILYRSDALRRDKPSPFFDYQNRGKIIPETLLKKFSKSVGYV